MVNKANMRLWVAGLRSGIFPQGRSRLKYVNVDGVTEYCCLGVVCDIAKIHGVTIVERPPGFAGGIQVNGSVGFLRPAVLQWLGLHPENENPIVGMGKVGFDDVTITATGANDDLGWDFLEIADGIESYYKLNEPDEEVPGDTPRAD